MAKNWKDQRDQAQGNSGEDEIGASDIEIHVGVSSQIPHASRTPPGFLDRDVVTVHLTKAKGYLRGNIAKVEDRLRLTRDFREAVTRLTTAENGKRAHWTATFKL
jgi:hypothetical protein